MSGFPDFYLVGAAKAGTTSLWNHLAGHPQVFLGPIKEPNYFAFGPEGPNVVGPAPAAELGAKLHGDTVTDEGRYLSLFAPAVPGQRTGEASVRYLYKPNAASRIATARPDARIIIMLRDPLDRLHSHYTMNRSLGLEPLGLEAAVAAEDGRVEAGWGWDWHYVRVGLYAAQIERYLDLFDSEQVLVVGYDDFRHDPLGVFRTICAHIGVDTTFEPDLGFESKKAYVPRSKALDALRRPGGPLRSAAELLPASLTRRAGGLLRQFNHDRVERLDGAALRQVVDQLGPDRVALEKLLGRPEPWKRSTP